MAATQPFEAKGMSEPMSMEEEHSDDIALAGEYALHLLDDAERRAFEDRMTRDPMLRTLVRDWDDQLALLTGTIAAVDPAPAVKARLKNTLFPDTAERRRPFSTWLMGALVAVGVIVGAVILAPLLNPEVGPNPAFTAIVAAEDGSLIVSAGFIAETNTLAVSRQTGGAFPGRVLELWLIVDGADAPVSLGVLPGNPEARIDVPQTLAAQMQNAVLAISDEPLGGSPTGAPTGAVLAVGPVTGA